MYQIARIEFQKCNFLVLQGGTSTLRHLPVHASAERGAGAPLRSLPLQHSPPPLGEKQFWICLCLSFVPFMLGPIKENVYTKYDLRKFVIVSGVCIKIRTCRSEQILLTYSQSYNDVFYNASYSRGGVRATFFNSEGAKINNSLGPPVFDLLDTPLLIDCIHHLQSFLLQQIPLKLVN